MKKWGKFSKKNLGGFFRGVVYRGTCVGGMLGNKRQDFLGGSVGGAVNPNKF